jgi:cellulose synthase/poly-beta-1,6-N-acetylglucosamine synthase-like glycosyltransferase
VPETYYDWENYSETEYKTEYQATQDPEYRYYTVNKKVNEPITKYRDCGCKVCKCSKCDPTRTESCNCQSCECKACEYLRTSSQSRIFLLATVLFSFALTLSGAFLYTVKYGTKLFLMMSNQYKDVESLNKLVIQILGYPLVLLILMSVCSFCCLCCVCLCCKTKKRTQYISF